MGPLKQGTNNVVFLHDKNIKINIWVYFPGFPPGFLVWRV